MQRLRSARRNDLPQVPQLVSGTVGIQAQVCQTLKMCSLPPAELLQECPVLRRTLERESCCLSSSPDSTIDSLCSFRSVPREGVSSPGQQVKGGVELNDHFYLSALLFLSAWWGKAGDQQREAI